MKKKNLVLIKKKLNKTNFYVFKVEFLVNALES